MYAIRSYYEAEKRILAALALEEVAKELEIKIDSKLIEAEMNKTLAQYKNVKDSYNFV